MMTDHKAYYLHSEEYFRIVQKVFEDIYDENKHNHTWHPEDFEINAGIVLKTVCMTLSELVEMTRKK
jgi:hypothetical protein